MSGSGAARIQVELQAELGEILRWREPFRGLDWNSKLMLGHCGPRSSLLCGPPQRNFLRVVRPLIAMLLTLPDRPPAALARSPIDAGEEADAERLGVRAIRVGSFPRRTSFRALAPARLPICHRAVVLAPCLGRNLVVAAVARDEFLQVGGRIRAQPVGIAVVCHHDDGSAGAAAKPFGVRGRGDARRRGGAESCEWVSAVLVYCAGGFADVR